MSSVNIGDVFAITFEKIDHPKYCIITGITSEGTYTYSVFINSSIDFIARVKPHLLPLQIKITQNKNRFLSHDSFVGCEHYEIISQTQLNNLYQNKFCRCLGSLDPDDLVKIKDTIVNSELLSPEELQYYFQIPIT
jgi:hypothetical protein